jgi:hypothetical protein
MVRCMRAPSHRRGHPCFLRLRLPSSPVQRPSGHERECMLHLSVPPETCPGRATYARGVRRNFNASALLFVTCSLPVGKPSRDVVCRS